MIINSIFIALLDDIFNHPNDQFKCNLFVVECKND